MDIENHTYTDLIVTYIKECILNGTYKPGDKVKELVIAKKLSISRAPIREALQVLIQEGLVVWLPQKGKFITNLNSKQIRDSYYTGGILEAAAVSQAVDLYTARDIQRLEAITEKMRDIAENEKPIEKIAALDDQFHKVLFSRIENDLLKEFCRRSCQGLSKFLLLNNWLKLYTPKEVYLRHKVIVDALINGNAAALETVLREHYHDSGERMSKFHQERDDEKNVLSNTRLDKKTSRLRATFL